MIKQDYKCRECGKVIPLCYEEQDYQNWRNGMLIQHALPYLDDSERELMISGTCGECFDKLFNFGDEEL